MLLNELVGIGLCILAIALIQIFCVLAQKQIRRNENEENKKEKSRKTSTR